MIRIICILKAHVYSANYFFLSSFSFFFFSSPYFASWSHFYFHSSLFPSSRNSGSPSRARAIHPIFLPPLIATHHRFPSPSKQPPPDKTRVVNSTRRKPTHLSLSTTHPPRELGDLLEILTATFLFGDARQYRMSLISDLSFESFSSRGHFSFLASKASTPCRLIQKRSSA